MNNLKFRCRIEIMLPLPMTRLLAFWAIVCSLLCSTTVAQHNAWKHQHIGPSHHCFSHHSDNSWHHHDATCHSPAAHHPDWHHHNSHQVHEPYVPDHTLNDFSVDPWESVSFYESIVNVTSGRRSVPKITKPKRIMNDRTKTGWIKNPFFEETRKNDNTARDGKNGK